MPEMNPTPDWHALTDEMLQSALEKLTERAKDRLEQEHGISEAFSREVQNEELISALCERAMGNLADAYIFHLEAFMNAADPKEALRHLEHAEVIWQSESSIITQFDTQGSEVNFLSHVRGQAYVCLANRLEELTTNHGSPIKDEEVALCIGILAIMDHMLEQAGEPKTHAQRKQFREIARALT